MTIYLAETLPKNKVNLLGRNNVGIARIKMKIKPVYSKILKTKDFKNCINC
tara:strand:+ start:332 stop:484 length:153 start_codon:yes stop_codon:yes gene_type:complete